ncbi:NAD(P)-dependent oxidoreductase [Bradyrhizobium sp. SSUT112]|uniref:NAD(P)-dependent oxidoreductase n=1 Tax=Bradyrhizobium sp. SSUT112 TaxID=3040604 RepID=UPI0024471740|nr:NAD(P)-dependent oxidoreductase [Bradyrhizobium sp. SSUT112]MDH2352252.1 NAD(P)-dependent oxidoreductase [Bradyrhizobium sp. SSUT112]
MTGSSTFGFIGLGVMGEPMCRHLVQKTGSKVLVHDLNAEPVARLTEIGAIDAGSIAEVAKADIVFISMPSGEHLKKICGMPGGLVELARRGQTIVDLSTSPLKLTRESAGTFAAKGADYADAPVARTRAAAEAGTLAIFVGAAPDVFTRIEPLLRCFASEVTHCGDVGSGQVVKILNNMVVVGTVTALCEAAAIANSAGVSTQTLFDAFSKGSADSFALRNHGYKAVAAEQFPERVFSTDYMHKDVSYALDMARDAGIEAREAALGASLLIEASQAGFGANYWPVIAKIIERSSKKS